jgi:hypothetical protein
LVEFKALKKSITDQVLKECISIIWAAETIKFTIVQFISSQLVQAYGVFKQQKWFAICIIKGTSVTLAPAM